MTKSDALKMLCESDKGFAEVEVYEKEGDQYFRLFLVCINGDMSVRELPYHYDGIFKSVDDFEQAFKRQEYFFDVYLFNNEKAKKEEPQDKTIKWYKVKCSLFKQEFGVKRWYDLIDFMSKSIGFDYTITGQYTEPYTGVEDYYENGEIRRI